MITKVQSCFTRNATDPETFDGERETAECARQTYTDFVKLKHVFGSGKKKSMCLPTALSIVIAKRHFSDCLGVFCIYLIDELVNLRVQGRIYVFR